MARQSKWKLTLALYWWWLVGGPNLVRDLGSHVLSAVRAAEEAELRERDNRREVFKSWSLVCAASDGTVIRIRPGSMTLYVHGRLNQAAYLRLKTAWKESALLIRLPFPLTPVDRAFTTVGDWKLKRYEPGKAP